MKPPRRWKLCNWLAQHWGWFSGFVWDVPQYARGYVKYPNGNHSLEMSLGGAWKLAKLLKGSTVVYDWREE